MTTWLRVHMLNHEELKLRKMNLLGIPSLAKNLLRKAALSDYTFGALVSFSSAIDGVSNEKKITIKGLCLSAKSRVPKLYFTIGDARRGAT